MSQPKTKRRAAPIVRKEHPAAARFGRAAQVNRRKRPHPNEQRTSHIYRARSGQPGSGRATFGFDQTAEEVCRKKEACGGCEFVNQPYDQGLETKFKRGLQVLDEAGIEPHYAITDPVASPKELDYRSLFKLAVRPGKGKTFEDDNRFAIGLFKPGTHDIVEIDGCPLHTRPLKRLIDDLRDELEALHLSPYNEEDGSGDIRYLVARSAHLTGEIMLTVVVTRNLKHEMKLLLNNLRSREHHINACHMNINGDQGNHIFGNETIRIGGTNFLRERICEMTFEVGPTSFFQINPWQAINLYRRVERIAGPANGDQIAWDLYCGAGQMGLILARQGYKLLGIEENPEAIENANNNAKRNGLANVEFVAGRVEEVQSDLPEWAETPNLIIVNPSRRGLAAETRTFLKDLLQKNPATRLIYVSCEIKTLARDLKELTDSGRTVKQIEAFDMFPQTDNMEWLAVIS